MTPERKEEHKQSIDRLADVIYSVGLDEESEELREIGNDLLAALEEAEQRNKMSDGNYELLKTAYVRELTDERVAVAAAYWLDCSPHERTEADGIILARYARKAMVELIEAQQTIARQQAKIDVALSWTWHCGEANMLEVIAALKGGEGAKEA